MAYRSLRGVLLLVVVLPAWTLPAHAGLGGDAASVLADATEMHATVNSVSQQLYTIEEMTAEPGMRVREYLNREGIVFAVNWAGPVLPDLQRLLGTHYAEYTAALLASNHSGLQRSVRVSTGDLVVESGGHLRAYSGRAYLPALLPAGVPLAELN